MSALLFALVVASSPAHVPLDIALGATRVLDERNVQSYSVAPAGIVDVRPGPKFVIVAKRAGRATLELFDAKHQATIYDITVK